MEEQQNKQQIRQLLQALTQTMVIFYRNKQEERRGNEGGSKLHASKFRPMIPTFALKID